MVPPLVAVAHGSKDPRAAATITELMSLVRARARRSGLPVLQVRAAYLGHALPSVPDVLESLYRTQSPGPVPSAPRSGSPGPVRHEAGEQAAVVLPLLLTEAYHSATDLPAVLHAVHSRLPWLQISYGRPLGPHPGLVRALERRLAEASAPAAPDVTTASHNADDTTTPDHILAPADTAVVLAAAGSSRPAANAAVARTAAAWQAARGWRTVVPAYASAASPTPGEAVAALLRAGAPRVVVATYLLAPGVFADQVREASLAAGAETVSAALGAAPEVADVVVERYLQAATAAEAVQAS